VAPYISFVVTSRNDDHGGNLRERMQVFAESLIAQCERHRFESELVLVEWNPPHDRKRLAQALDWPASSQCRVRILEVPSKVHHQLKHSDRLPLFQMIAKNVGIRRAKGDFILATNIDILFSDELIRFLASRRLRRSRMYRVDRYDVPIPSGSTLEARLEFCRTHVFRIHQKDMIYNPSQGTVHPVYIPLTPRLRFKEALQDFGLLPVRSYSRLHTNASGDFTLMNRDHWHSLRGYPEFQMYSFHLDSVLCHAAYHAGLREVVLQDPMRIYHMEHAQGSGWSPEGKEQLQKRLREAGVPQLEHSQFARWAIEMRKNRAPRIFNDENWGFADQQLPEIELEGSGVSI
jgi:hypothetical protein